MKIERDTKVCRRYLSKKKSRISLDKYGYCKDTKVHGRYLSEDTLHTDPKVASIYWHIKINLCLNKTRDANLYCRQTRLLIHNLEKDAVGTI